MNTAGELVLSFNENLDAQHPPQNKDFTILIDGVLRTPDSITITGQTLALNFTPPIYSGQSVQVIYTDPTAQND
ncbi:SwmB domain-containing protein, partial [Acinetobacter sp. TY1]|uniref:SwmB domain-containing protein n=1 Tax=Acinetobacter sp. TY1 TaxID=3387626 RepID=UPI003AF93200